MKPTIRIHQPHAETHLPAHEQTARRCRQKASLPPATRRTRPTHPPTPPASPTGRKTLDLRFTLI